MTKDKHPPEVPDEPLVDYEEDLLSEKTLDAINDNLYEGFVSVETADFLFGSTGLVLCPDEAAALCQIRNDLATVIVSMRRRLRDGDSYEQPQRISELREKIATSY